MTDGPMTPDEIRQSVHGRVATDADVDRFLLVLSIMAGRTDEVGVVGRAAETLRACWPGSQVGPDKGLRVRPGAEVFVVQHETRDGDVKLLGIQHSPEAGQDAVARARRQPGFRDHPDGFDVSKMVVGRDQWPRGFVAAGRPTPAPDEAACCPPCPWPACRLKVGDRVRMVPGLESFCGQEGRLLSVKPRLDPSGYDTEVPPRQSGWLLEIKLDGRDQPCTFGHEWVQGALGVSPPE